MGQLLNDLWQTHPTDLPEPTKAGITFSGAAHANSHTPSLFAEDNAPQRMQLQHAMDTINKAHGGRSLYYADVHQAQRSSEAAQLRISSTHIPNLELES